MSLTNTTLFWIQQIKKRKYVEERNTYLVIPNAYDLCNRDVIDGNLLIAADLNDQGPPAYCLDNPVLFLPRVNLQTTH